MGGGGGVGSKGSWWRRVAEVDELLDLEANEIGRLQTFVCLCPQNSFFLESWFAYESSLRDMLDLGFVKPILFVVIQVERIKFSFSQKVQSLHSYLPYLYVRFIYIISFRKMF